MLFRSDRKSTRLNSSHTIISYAVFCLKKKNKKLNTNKTSHSEHTIVITEVCLLVCTRCLLSACPCVALLTHRSFFFFFFFFFNDTATPEIYPLSLHDALPICQLQLGPDRERVLLSGDASVVPPARSEEHTSELQSHDNLVCRLLLEKKKK